ncbi:MAG: hypothetical protein ABI318_15235 [Chthoniobacteraceae bacterium]
MIGSLTQEEKEDVAKAAKNGISLLDIRVADDAESVSTKLLFEGFSRALEGAKSLSEGERRNQIVNLLGIAFGQFIVWEAGWNWSWFISEADLMELCVTDPDQHYLALPLANMWSLFNGNTHTLELHFRMIKGKKLPPAKTGELILLSPAHV